ncbi:TRAP transporter large permease subunit [Sulfitobacter sp. M220]|jgi:tripartite ATP-independent transporter DctM subunit|uniref:TRAP transporter large permease n=1 Tax=Sulfitobacter TaxID=60136 RepID=UPI001110CB7F|nr:MULTISPECIES: TRAP transporter large permease [unclassified Sulfitobacter]MCF7725626.1 TRAP transporter large permease subunit [Sulfitobacter sp. M22]MCF7777010.1 TRAP transporter large permease subunit [Sulfitobacter sp. M220]|tara:strand:+ start:954 stop:2261 length:1308 start_codon:yes stop_codon:yes gene_type:complete
MSNLEIGLICIGVLVFLVANRVPIGFALIGVSFVGIYWISGPRAAWGTISLVPQTFAATWTLSSIPMFLMMGYVSYRAGLTRGLFKCARLWLSALPGGLAVASVFGAAGFAAVAGSSIACSAAMGRIAFPEMVKYNYDPKLAAGTLAVAGTLGALIPPSILMILYGIIAQVPIASLFVGGISVGLITALGYIGLIIVRVKLKPELAPAVNEEITWGMRFRALRETIPILVLVLGVFGGLLAGFFTPTEAGAVGSVLSILISIASRSLSFEDLWEAAVETLTTTSGLFIIGCGAALLIRFLALSGSGEFITNLVIGFGSDPIFLILGIAVIYLVLGMFLEPIGAMLLTLPIVLPIVETAGFNLIWFGVFLTKLLEIGMISPPMGMNVFVIKGVVGDKVSLGGIFQGILWFLMIDLVIGSILVAFPELVLIPVSWLN